MENTVESQPNNNAMYYILGVIVLIAVVAAGYFMRPKTTLPSPVVSQPTAAASPTPGPITRLGCDMQYYNPVLGFTKYFISVEGGDIT